MAPPRRLPARACRRARRRGGRPRRRRERAQRGRHRCGLALYASFRRVTPVEETGVSAMRMPGGWNDSSPAGTIESMSTPSASAAAAAASAFVTLCRPGDRRAGWPCLAAHDSTKRSAQPSARGRRCGGRDAIRSARSPRSRTGPSARGSARPGRAPADRRRSAPRSATAQRGEEICLASRDASRAAQVLDVRGRDAGDDADAGSRDRREARDLARCRSSRARGPRCDAVPAQAEQGERQAELVVQVPVVLQHASGPETARIAAHISLVVVLPLLPVIATSGRRSAGDGPAASAPSARERVAYDGDRAARASERLAPGSTTTRAARRARTASARKSWPS